MAFRQLLREQYPKYRRIKRLVKRSRLTGKLDILTKLFNADDDVAKRLKEDEASNVGDVKNWDELITWAKGRYTTGYVALLLHPDSREEWQNLCFAVWYFTEKPSFHVRTHWMGWLVTSYDFEKKEVVYKEGKEIWEGAPQLDLTRRFIETMPAPWASLTKLDGKTTDKLR